MPAYVNRAYFTDHARYETAAEYRERIRLDAVKMTEYLRTKAEVNPHVFVWPYGEANGIAIAELKNSVMTCSSPLNQVWQMRRN